MYNNILTSSTNPEPTVHLIGQLYDVRDWLSPFVQRIKGISKAHHFWFFRNEQGEVVMQFKEFITDAEWRPYHNEEPLEIFRRDINGRQIVPDTDGPYSIPDLVEADFYKKVDHDELVKSVEHCRTMMDLSQYGWWLKWLKKDQVQNVWDQMADRWDWPLNVIGHHIPLASVEPAQANKEVVPISVSTQKRSINLLKKALKHAVGLYAIYKPKRSTDLEVGLIKEATNEEATLMRFQENKDGTWVQTRGKNKVCKSDVVQLFPKFNLNRTLPMPMRNILEAGYQPPDDSEADDESDAD